MLALLVISTPTFVIANLVDTQRPHVNNAIGVQIFEYTGETSPDAIGGGWNQFVDRLQHLVLPSFTLALTAIAGYSSATNATRCLDVLGQGLHQNRTRQRALLAVKHSSNMACALR